MVPLRQTESYQTTLKKFYGVEELVMQIHVRPKGLAIVNVFGFGKAIFLAFYKF